MSVDLFSQAFSLVADQLEALRDDPKLSPRDRNRFLRFAPFLRQLGKRPKFYKDLARDEYSAMSLDLTFDEIVSLFARYWNDTVSRVRSPFVSPIGQVC